MHFNHTAPVLNTDIKRGNDFFRKKLLFSEQTNGTFPGSRYIMVFTLLLKPQFFKICTRNSCLQNCFVQLTEELKFFI
jgi:hypothetical protein